MMIPPLTNTTYTSMTLSNNKEKPLTAQLIYAYKLNCSSTNGNGSNGINTTDSTTSAGIYSTGSLSTFTGSSTGSLPSFTGSLSTSSTGSCTDSPSRGPSNSHTGSLSTSFTGSSTGSPPSSTGSVVLLVGLVVLLHGSSIGIVLVLLVGLVLVLLVVLLVVLVLLVGLVLVGLAAFMRGRELSTLVVSLSVCLSSREFTLRSSNLNTACSAATSLSPLMEKVYFYRNFVSRESPKV